MIDALKKEYDTLIADYRVTTSASNKTKDKRQMKIINKLLKMHNCFYVKIAREKANLKEIAHQIRKIEKQVMALRPRDITDHQCHLRIKSAKQTIEKLENILNNHIKRFCVTLAENRTKRHEIDHLLKERYYITTKTKQFYLYFIFLGSNSINCTQNNCKRSTMAKNKC